MTRQTFSKQWMRMRRRRDDTETTRNYTPADVQALVEGKANGAGIIRPDTGELHLPQGLEEQETTGNPHRVMLVIVTLALLFIAIIAYFVAEMPIKN